MASEVCWDPKLSTLDHRPSATPNAWFLELAVLQGSPMALLFQVAPQPHQWVLFRRDNGFKIHAYRWSRFAQKVGLSS
jgi:hypothetical protein